MEVSSHFIAQTWYVSVLLYIFSLVPLMLRIFRKMVLCSLDSKKCEKLISLVSLVMVSGTRGFFVSRLYHQGARLEPSELHALEIPLTKFLMA